MTITREEALVVLGLKGAPATDDIKRAFKLQALKWHPDKNRHDPKTATSQFQRLVSAYQRLANPSAGQSWEDMDVTDILTEDFFEEALRMHDVPSFQLMFIHEAMANAGAGRHQEDASAAPCVWADAGTVKDTHAQEVMWRRIHESLQKRRAKGSGQRRTGSRDRGHFTGSREEKLAMFWDFVSAFVRHDAADFCVVDDQGGVVAEALPRPSPSTTPQLLLPAAVCAAPRRRARTPAPHNVGAHTLEQHSQREGNMGGQERQATSSTASTTVAAGMDEQQPAAAQNQVVGGCEGSGGDQGEVQQGQGACEGGDVTQAQGLSRSGQQPQRLRVRTNWGFYWTWAKRILLLKAISMLLRT